MAGPGAPSRPPRRRLTGRPVAAPALRRGPRSATSPPGDLPGSARLPRAAASTAAPAGAHRPRPLPPGPRVRRGAMWGAGGTAIRAEGAAWGQRAPRARPSPPPEPQGACARRGRGARACVCVGAGRAAARGVILSTCWGPGPGMEERQIQRKKKIPYAGLQSQVWGSAVWSSHHRYAFCTSTLHTSW